MLFLQQLTYYWKILGYHDTVGYTTYLYERRFERGSLSDIDIIYWSSAKLGCNVNDLHLF